MQVPLATVGLAVFSVFPAFQRLEAGLQKWLVNSLVPDTIARPVLQYLTQFAGKAGQLGWTGAAVLLVTALALVLTIDRKLNDIWRVRRPRPLRGGHAGLRHRAPGGEGDGCGGGLPGEGFHPNPQALLDDPLRLRKLADELGGLVEDDVLGEFLERLPLRRHSGQA